MRIYFYIFIIIIVSIKSIHAQAIDYVQGYIGTRFFPQDEQRGEDDKLPRNIYAGYAPGQVLGGTVYRQVTDRLCIGGNFEIGNTFKKNFNLNLVTLGLQAKFNFTNIEYFLSPYIVAGPNLSFMTLSRQEYTEDVTTNSQNQNELIIPTGYKFRESKTDFFFMPVVGFNAGAGLEIKMTEGWGIYGEYRFNYTYSKDTPLLKAEYPTNNSNLIFHNTTVGLRLFL
ncbi:MAG: outer membrane beta-barrel protein [Bacteroidota bacterium]|nr:outer membrane beta-barrel protein [Bacteroidota bacterium]